MPLTRSFRETVQARARRDRRFRLALLQEATDLFLSGDVAAGKIMLRDYVNATVGFAELAEAVDTPSKSLMRMLSPAGNPRAANLFAVIAQLQKLEGVQLRVGHSRV